MTRAEHLQHRHDAAEDAEEELADLENRIPREVVGFARGLRGENERERGNHDEEAVAAEGFEREVDAENRDFNA